MKSLGQIEEGLGGLWQGIYRCMWLWNSGESPLKLAPMLPSVYTYGLGVTVGNAQGVAPLQFGSHIGSQFLTLPLSWRETTGVCASGQ